MGDHVVLYVDCLTKPVTSQSTRGAEAPELSGEGSHGYIAVVSASTGSGGRIVEEHEEPEEEMPLIQMVECRICQEEDHIKNLESPCACSGSLKFAHRNCVQRWCEEKRDTICEICHQPYQPGYTAPPPSPRPLPDETSINIGGGWMISGTSVDLHDPRFVAVAADEHRLLETEYDEYAGTNASGSAFCRFAALILLGLFLLRHGLETTSANSEDDDDVSTFFSIFLLRALGFLLPCYIMAWAISILQRRREGEEEAGFVAPEVAFVLQSGQERGLQFTILPAPAVTHLEPHQ